MSVTYANDILPKFRAGDVTCMKRKRVMLDDAQWMCDPSAGDGFDDHSNARRVYSALADGFMPPDGAWSKEWLGTYQTWMDEGFRP